MSFTVGKQFEVSEQYCHIHALKPRTMWGYFRRRYIASRGPCLIQFGGTSFQTHMHAANNYVRGEDAWTLIYASGPATSLQASCPHDSPHTRLHTAELSCNLGACTAFAAWIGAQQLAVAQLWLGGHNEVGGGCVSSLLSPSHSASCIAHNATHN